LQEIKVTQHLISVDKEIKLQGESREIHKIRKQNQVKKQKENQKAE
jgi:hypothetical protein